MMKMDCPAHEELVGFALRHPATSAPTAIGAHARECAACRTEVSRIRELTGALRSAASVDLPGSGSCLSDEEIAVLLADPPRETDARQIEHLSGCAGCRRRLAAITALVRDDAVAGEIHRLGVQGRTAGHYRAIGLIAAGVVGIAAVGTLAVLRDPAASSGTDDASATSAIHRESAITTTVAPRIVGSARVLGANDSLRWTSVPHADRYQVMVFDRDGTLVWDPQTSDTGLAVPDALIRDTSTTYLWKVEARTGWDRWVASEWEYLTVDPPLESHEDHAGPPKRRSLGSGG